MGPLLFVAVAGILAISTLKDPESARIQTDAYWRAKGLGSGAIIGGIVMGEMVARATGNFLFSGLVTAALVGIGCWGLVSAESIRKKKE